MRKQINTVLAVSALLMAAGIPLIYAGGAASAKANFEVEFGFKVGEIVYPGGAYEITFTEGNEYFVLRNKNNGKAANISFVSRTSGRGKCKGCGKPLGEAELVFQQDEGAPYLTDIYMPKSDGFHLGGAPGKQHRHVSMEPSK